MASSFQQMQTPMHDETNIRMATVPTSAESPEPAQEIVPKRRASAFNFTSLVQKAGVYLLIGLLSVGCYFMFSRFLLQSVQVIGESMVPTLGANSRYLLNRWVFHNREPQRGEVVVIRDPGTHGLAVKRVVAVAGESVLFKNGKVYVNGQQLKEPYLAPRTYTFTYSQAKEQFITCGKDQYFVLGDNRTQSVDSRAYGPVSRADVLGLLMIHPLDQHASR
jgi:signal peptidase I